MARKKIENKESQIVLNQIPTSATDSVSVSVRSSGDILIQLFSLVPEDVRIENHRTLIKKDLAVSLINILSAGTGHYPQKPKTKAKKKVAIKKGTTKK